MPVLITFTSILSVLFLPLKDVVICSPALIVSPGGPKPYQSPTSLLKLFLALLLHIGYLPLVLHPLLQLTAVPSLNHPSFTALTNLLGTKRIRTTAYHPCANGIVECSHRQLKACLKASSDSSKWTELLHLILLSLRTTVKQDLQCTPAQLVYGTALRLPGQFFIPSPATMPLDPTLYADRLSSYMHQLRPVPPRLQSPPSHVPPNLSTCTHVFGRHDAIRKPLDPPSDGPYQFIRCHEKLFILDIHGKHISVTLDRLKPAHLDSAPVDNTSANLQDSPTSDAPQSKVFPRTTRSG